MEFSSGQGYCPPSLADPPRRDERGIFMPRMSFSHRGPPAAVAERAAQPDTRDFLVGLARAFGGAILFALPLLMTAEMWELGITMGPARLALFLAMMLPVLGGLAYYAGFEESFGWRDFVLHALIAYAVAFVAAAAVLLLLNVLGPGLSVDEVVGKVALQAVPGSIGAMLARSQLGAQDEEQDEKRRRDTYVGSLFTAGVGALFFAFNIAPTDEVVLLAQMMTGRHAVALAVVSLLMMHAFVYAVEFRGQHAIAPGISPWSEFLRLTVVAYALALLISLYVLWIFGRADGLAFPELLIETVVLGFPAALGAAAARLIL
jgi:putative integral membrane protein (TIGR02587 family)